MLTRRFRKNLKVTRILTFLMSFGLLILLTGGTVIYGQANASDKVELSIWLGDWMTQPRGGFAVETPVIDRAINSFKKEYPNVEFTVVPIGWTVLFQKEMAALAMGEAGDVISMWSGWAQTFARTGSLMDLTDIVKDIGEDAWIPLHLQWGEYDGKYYVLPYATDPKALYYNKNMFAAAGLDPNQPPKTLDELYEYAKKIKSPGKEQFGFAIPLALQDPTVTIYFQHIVHAFGGSILNENWTKSLINQPAAVEAANWYLVKLKDVVPAAALQMTNDDVWRWFFAEKCAMGYVLPAYQMLIKKENPTLDFGIAPNPGLKTANAGWPAKGMALGVSSFSKNPEMAREFAKFIMRPEVTEYFCYNTPALKASWKYPPYQEPGFQVYLGLLQDSTQSLIAPRSAGITREVNLGLQRIFLGEDAEKVFDEVAEKIDRLLL